jgi:hypothetical protein
VGSAPCGGFRSKHPVETLFNDFFTLNQGMKRVCTAFLERKPPQGADSTWASAHKVGISNNKKTKTHISDEKRTKR